jgi:hypothetical protein
MTPQEALLHHIFLLVGLVACVSVPRPRKSGAATSLPEV